jgi:DNA-directed RNA polymerase subunit RPC12/RpoP
MSDLINRDELIVRLNRVKKTYKIDDRVIGTVSGMPAVDAESVRYGQWIRGGANDMHRFDFHCSECNKSFHLGSLATIYDVKREWIHCPNCGAKMDGEKEGV